LGFPRRLRLRRWYVVAHRQTDAAESFIRDAAEVADAITNAQGFARARSTLI
jgi:hypothetical protein